MTGFKDYIAKEFIGRKLYFKCDCLFNLDHVGIVVDYEIISNEIVFIVDINGKLIKIGENHPNIQVKAI